MHVLDVILECAPVLCFYSAVRNSGTKRKMCSICFFVSENSLVAALALGLGCPSPHARLPRAQEPIE